jgi:WD40-like Beta Propeller Repeat
MARPPALLAALLLAGSASAAGVQSAKPPRMAFVSPQGGAFDVWTARLDGGEMRRLTRTKAYDSFPAWSPDGTRIVFVTDRRAVGKLWVVNADGRGLRRLTRGGSKDADPAWSPKGSLIAYPSTARPPGIWLVRPDGTHARPLRRRGVGGGAPSWSPNARQIAFAARCAQDALHTCVYAISASGTRRRTSCIRLGNGPTTRLPTTRTPAGRPTARGSSSEPPTRRAGSQSSTATAAASRPSPPERSKTGSTRPGGLASSVTILYSMPFYQQLGTVPRKQELCARARLKSGTGLGF